MYYFPFLCIHEYALTCQMLKWETGFKANDGKFGKRRSGYEMERDKLGERKCSRKEKI